MCVCGGGGAEYVKIAPIPRRFNEPADIELIINYLVALILVAE